ncbi:MAG: hypothetical protein AB1894_25945 [Chloroflexota bacterium]
MPSQSQPLPVLHRLLTLADAAPRPGFLLLLGPHAASQAMLALAAHLALRSSLRILDGGNRFNAYLVARALRRLSPASPLPALARIQVARAFTCYQMAALIESQPPVALPTLVIDLLDTFYDQSASLHERRRLLHRCLARLQRLSQGAPTVVSLRPPPPGQTDPTGLQDLVHDAAAQLFILEVPASPRQSSAAQLDLF